MSLIYNKITPVFLGIYFAFTSFSYGQQEKAKSMTLTETTTFVMKTLIGDAIRLDADETSFFKNGLIILRKDDQFAVMNQHGVEVAPYGTYLFPTPLRAKNDYYPSYFSNWLLQVRSPATGLYGFIKPDGKIFIPLNYNEVTPLNTNEYLYSYAIGARHEPNGKKKYFLLNYQLENNELPLPDEAFASKLFQEGPTHFIIPAKNKYDGFSRFNNLFGQQVLQTKRKATYYNHMMFRVDSSFNGLNKVGFINMKDSLFIPYQNIASYQISNFQMIQKDRIPNYVSVLSGYGENSFFNYALMDQTGRIYSRLKNGEGLNRIDLPEKDVILRNKILVSADKAGEDSDLFLWDVTAEKKLVNIEKLFRTANAPYFNPRVKAKLTFTYISRQGTGISGSAKNGLIKFKLEAFYFPTPEMMALMPWAEKKYTGGLGGGVLDGLQVSGIGLMDETTGAMVIPPIFNVLEAVDPNSGLAYGEITIGGKLFKGFVDAKRYNDYSGYFGKFQFLLKDNY